VLCAAAAFLVCVLTFASPLPFSWIIRLTQEDFQFKATSNPHLVEFLEHIPRLDAYRQNTRGLDELLYNSGANPHDWYSLPDVLSKNRDYVDLKALDGESLDFTSGIFLPHKGMALTDIIPFEVALPNHPSTPVCDSELGHSMGDYQHLTSVSTREELTMSAEVGLLEAAWWTGSDKTFSNEEMGTRVAVQLQENHTSWVLFNLAAMYWRIEGDYLQTIECLRRALHHSPTMHKDVALLQLGGVLLRTQQFADAQIVTEAALRISDTLYATNFVHGNILASQGNLARARDAYERAVTLQPDLGSAYRMLEAVTAKIKVLAVASRRQYEINLRKVSMVLSDDLTWDHFDYEASEDPCADAVCKENSECSNVDGKCHCNEGWLAIDGECLPDTECGGIECKSNSICRDGRCYCKIGYRVVDSVCVEDLCATVVCVDHAECHAEDGRCHCTDPYVLQGAECVEASCLDTNCRPDSVCRGGNCYCNVGFVPDNDVCVEEKGCSKSQCPAHATCNPTDGHCRCKTGYTADIHKNLCLRDGGESEEIASTADDVPPTSSGTAEPVKESVKVEAAAATPTPSASEQSVDDDDAAESTDGLSQVGPEVAAILRVSKSFCSKVTLTVAQNETENGTDWMHNICLYLPLPGSTEEQVVELVEKLVPKKKPTEKKKRKTPVCSAKDPLPRTHMLDHIPGMGSSATADWAKVIAPEVNAHTHLFQMINFLKRSAVFKGVSESLLLDEVGHRLALRLRKEPFNLRLLDLAVLWWRAWGDRREALECVRHYLHWAGETKSKATSGVDMSPYSFVHAANIFLHGRQMVDAEIFSELALATLKEDPLVIYLNSMVKAARGWLNSASLDLAKFLVDHPRHPPARDLLHAIRCTQLKQESGLENGAVTSDLPGGDVDFYGEAKELKARLEALRTLLSGKRMNEIAQGDQAAELWSELEQDEKRLEKLLEMQQLASKLKKDIEVLEDKKSAPVSSLELDTDSSKSSNAKRGRRVLAKKTSDEDDEVDESGQKVVVVEYPKSPSIPSLITAVAEMFSKKPDAPGPRKRLPFEHKEWPTTEDCKGVEEQHTRFMNTWMSVAAKNIDIRDHIDIDTEINTVSENYLPPICDSPVSAKPVHTLEHIEGIAKRATISMLPEHALREVIRRLNEPRGSGVFNPKVDETGSGAPPPLPIDEVGERTRLALEKNASNWVALNIAALYWRVEGNATQSIECLRRAFFHSGSGQKDVALVSIANVLHLSGHTVDAVTIMQMAIQVAPKMALNHFTLANILYMCGASSVQQAAFFYEATLRFQADFHPALVRLLQLRCKAKGIE
jgi:tetratricopeptide (TPR) repeat protein